MRAPEELFTVHRDVTFDDRPMLLYAFSGFVDAGGGVRLAADHILASCQHQLVATFDVDELLDYRARRPRMTYVVDHFASVEVQQIVLHEVTMPPGSRSCSSPVRSRTTSGCASWPRSTCSSRCSTCAWRSACRRSPGRSAHEAAGHHRPRQRAELVAGHVSVIGEIEVPGHVGAMLELHLGQQGIPSMGVTAQVPHYLVQFEFPRAASTLLAGVSAATGLALPVADLEPSARRADAEVAQQLQGNEEFATVVAALEQQYDQMAAITSGATGGLGDLAADGVPTGDEIAAQVELFLSSL